MSFHSPGPNKGCPVAIEPLVEDMDSNLAGGKGGRREGADAGEHLHVNVGVQLEEKAFRSDNVPWGSPMGARLQSVGILSPCDPHLCPTRLRGLGSSNA